MIALKTWQASKLYWKISLQDIPSSDRSGYLRLARHFGDGSEMQAEHFSDVQALIASQPEFAANETILVKGSRGVQLDQFVDNLSASIGVAPC